MRTIIAAELVLLTAYKSVVLFLLSSYIRSPLGKDKAGLSQGTLDMLVLKAVETMGPLQGWAIAKRIEQVSQDLLEMKNGTLYPALMRLEAVGP